jgi:hypothetical protein
MSKNEGAWQALFASLGILPAVDAIGSFTITSDQINGFRESRLMTKFDHHANLPEIFKRNGLSILPITRGSYVIGRFDAYMAQSFEKDSKAEEFRFPANIESLNPSDIFSESAAINCAFVSGMIDEIAGERMVPTLAGRMGSSRFDFSIRSKTDAGRHRLQVDNSQCEIDGGFEGPGSLVIIEAKNAISEDFIIRQLYYPFRLWQAKVAKKIIPVFLSYSNDVFHFFIYEFADRDDYNSIRLVRRRDFTFAPQTIGMEDIQAILANVGLVAEPLDPFPQADKFERVVDLLALLGSGQADSQSITENYDFDPRQTQYYMSACRYLGLIDGAAGQYGLSKDAARIPKLGYKQKYLALARRILAHKVFHETCKLYLESGGRPAKEDIIRIMKASQLRNMGSDSTFKRRAQTVVSWVEWVLGLPS